MNGVGTVSPTRKKRNSESSNESDSFLDELPFGYAQLFPDSTTSIAKTTGSRTKKSLGKKNSNPSSSGSAAIPDPASIALQAAMEFSADLEAAKNDFLHTPIVYGRGPMSVAK